MINETPIITIPRITDLPLIVTSNNPTAKWKLKGTKCLHRQVTWNNTPGIMPDSITPCDHTASAHQQLPRMIQRTHAIDVLTLMEQASLSMTHTPCALTKYAKMPINFKHYANPKVHPVTGATITSYRKLMHDPATAGVWQTAFGRDFGGMAKGENKKRSEGHECNVRDDTQQDCAYPCSEKTFHLRKPCHQLQTTKRVPSLHSNNSGG